jgi:hypothetical protein
MKILIKLSLSGIILYYAISQYSDKNSGLLKELQYLSLPLTITLVIVFFIAVAFYCQTLQRCLTLISPKNRKASPNSVWMMFLLPYNFIEDFFIIINISNSLEEEAKFNKKLVGINDYGMVMGVGWSIAQILSLIPNIAGQVASVLGLLLWIFHWGFIKRVNRLLDN